MSSSLPTPVSSDITTSEHLRDARARAWAFVFDCYRKKEAAPESRPDDAKEIKNDSRHQHRNT